MPKNTFKYVFIPADSSVPVESKTASASGGLSNDELVKTAKQYFFEQSGGGIQARMLREASPEERQAVAQQFRESQGNNPQLQQLEDAQILSFIESQHANPNCEIMALTVPTQGNGYYAVSQKTPGIYGDVFVGRCYDNEGEDEWRRADFGPEDLEEIDWIQIARAQGGGGGSGASNVASLTGTMGQLKQQQEQQKDLGYTWSQTSDEIELKFSVAASITSKTVSVKFSRSSLTVKVGGETLLEGPTGGNVAVDDSTYTLQDDDQGGRELCIVLGKIDEGRNWAYAVKQ
ncbi:hypothetical protein MHU86_25163 [Fragilaria crotonensis]|nr:hypothetical protein MHU86_25163 [Fragilaria crotonensis]